MRCLVAIVILLLGNHYVLASSNKCRKSDNCTCIKTSDEYEFQCSSSNNDVVVIHAIPDKYMKLDCLNEEEFNLENLPNYTAGIIELFEIRFCPLPDDYFLFLLERFGVENLENLRLEDVELRKNSSEKAAPITKDFFRGLTSLRTLGISYLSSPLETDAFGNLSNLTVLYLENNNIEEIGGMFGNLKDLKVLHLSCNSLTNIPNGTFRNLSELQQLHLWKNNLTGIGKSYFSGLYNLKSLELSRNRIQFIDNDAFSDLSELLDISLRENQLGHIPSDLFRHNAKLYSIRMDYSFNVTLEDYAFANLKNLSTVNLEHSGLQNIPEHVFEGSENIQILKLQSNFLQDLPEMVFSSLKHLKELDLTGNNVSSIPDDLFSPLVDLEVLKLGGNLISEIKEHFFKRTKNLKKLYLNRNRIKTIAPNSFYKHDNLIFMDVSSNLYDMKNKFGDGNPFMNCRRLKQLILSGNSIDEFPSSIMLMVELAELDLSHNNIKQITVSVLTAMSEKGTKIDLSNNEISFVDFGNAEALAKYNLENYKNGTVPVTTALLHDNPLACDCRIYDLVRYINDKLDPALKTTIALEVGDDKCASPEMYRHIEIRELRPQHVSCQYPWPCKSSSGCPCFHRPFDEAVVIDCSYKNLTECPTIEVDHKRVELNLIGNMIRRGPNSSLGYDNVTNMFLSNNRIEEFGWVPPRTQVLKLDGNQLTHFDSEVLKTLDSTSVLTLFDNPWSCDCSAFDFQNFIRAKFGKESKDIVCKEDGKPLIEKKQLCKPISALILQIAIPILLFLVLTAVGSTMYFCYQEEINIWLYSNKYTRWLVPEEKLDKDKKFDIFLSYSHKDEDFVLQNLLPALEDGPDPFDICIHVRNWTAGEFITKQIADSVNDSRRTLVVLSNDFLESVWGKMEFRAAHTKAIKEGRARVIVIKYGELDEEKLDEEMKMYLKTNTYVEWGNPWFWRTLRYALPHKRSLRASKRQKHANMMLKIEDGFKLAAPPLGRAESTPPVAGLDPAMLTNSPLSYKRSEKLETPPAETPLVIPIGRD